jgi:hypothetical protein
MDADARKKRETSTPRDLERCAETLVFQSIDRSSISLLSLSLALSLFHSLSSLDMHDAPLLVLFEWSDTVFSDANLAQTSTHHLAILDAHVTCMLREWLARPLLGCYVCVQKDNPTTWVRQLKKHLPQMYALLAKSRIGLVFGQTTSPEALAAWWTSLDRPTHVMAVGVTLGIMCAQAIHQGLLGDKTDSLLLLKQIDLAPSSTCMQLVQQVNFLTVISKQVMQRSIRTHGSFVCKARKSVSSSTNTRSWHASSSSSFAFSSSISSPFSPSSPQQDAPILSSMRAPSVLPPCFLLDDAAFSFSSLSFSVSSSSIAEEGGGGEEEEEKEKGKGKQVLVK